MNKEEIGGLGIAFGAGLIVGGIVALLYAPQSGRETRQAIKSKTEDVVENVRGKLGHGKRDEVVPH